MTPWLSILGIGEDGVAGLTPAARALLAQATFVVGGARHLALLGETPSETLVWPSPLTGALDAIAARRGASVVVLASGDPFFYGVGDLLARHVARDEIICIPAPSAFSLAAARMKWSQQDCASLSLHGRAFERITPHLQPRARVLALSWDETTPARVAAHLVALGMGASRLTVLEHLGGPRERLRESRADAFALGDIAALNMLAIEVEAPPGARTIPLTPGLPDDWFENDGQLTKRDIRAVTLCALAPRKGEMLWDVGAGSGSIGIEWMLADPANRTIAIEPHPERAARIARNAAALGAPGLEIVQARAPAALDNLAPPDAVFIGGGGGDVVAAVWERIPIHTRLVANAVTLETQSSITRFFADRGGELAHLQVAHARPVGGYHALDPAMAVLQWRGVKR